MPQRYKPFPHIEPNQIAFCVAAVLVFWLAMIKWPVVTASAQEVIESRILVQCNAEYGIQMCEEEIAMAGGRVEKWIAPISVAYVRQVSTDEARTLPSMLTSLRKADVFLSAEYDEPVFGVTTSHAQGANTIPPHATIPPEPVQVNDPNFNNPNFVYAPQLIGAPSAWLHTQGAQQIVVAVLDTGVSAQHPDLQGQLLPNGYDFINANGDPDDDHGHGTHVAGIIAALADNGIGSAGICPGCKILPVKVLNRSNTSTWATVIEGIVYAVDNGAHIINLSLGGISEVAAVRAAVDYAHARGVLVIAAAGNSRSERPFYPAAFEGVLGIGATTNSDTIWSLSNSGNYIDLVAPGATIYSTYYDLDNYYGGYIFMSGTSMATPHVAGLAGLLLSQDATRSANDVVAILISTAHDLGDVGKDKIYGYGRIDAWAALNFDPPTPLNNARLGGMLWLDEDQSGTYEAGETRSLPLSVSIAVSNSIGQFVQEVSAGDTEWHLSGLYPGRYSVCCVGIPEFSFSTPICNEIDVSANVTINDINFGLYQPFLGFLPYVAGN